MKWIFVLIEKMYVENYRKPRQSKTRQDQTRQGKTRRTQTRRHHLVLENHDDVIRWKHFLRYWPFVGGIHWPPVDSPHKGSVTRGFVFLCAPEQTVEHTIETPVIWDAITLIMTSQMILYIFSWWIVKLQLSRSVVWSTALIEIRRNERNWIRVKWRWNVGVGWDEG